MTVELEEFELVESFLELLEEFEEVNSEFFSSLDVSEEDASEELLSVLLDIDSWFDVWSLDEADELLSVSPLQLVKQNNITSTKQTANTLLALFFKDLTP